ncbi:LIM domain and actin-binding protein 1 [Chytridiales sp. JEL 0842]|nr:LIM domain and actin-binding protein 1 [Chytridiales sp. JEL 0842]
MDVIQARIQFFQELSGGGPSTAPKLSVSPPTQSTISASSWKSSLKSPTYNTTGEKQFIVSPSSSTGPSLAHSTVSSGIAARMAMFTAKQQDQNAAPVVTKISPSGSLQNVTDKANTTTDVTNNNNEDVVKSEPPKSASSPETTKVSDPASDTIESSPSPQDQNSKVEPAAAQQRSWSRRASTASISRRSSQVQISTSSLPSAANPDSTSPSIFAKIEKLREAASRSNHSVDVASAVSSENDFPRRMSTPSAVANSTHSEAEARRSSLSSSSSSVLKPISTNTPLVKPTSTSTTDRASLSNASGPRRTSASHAPAATSTTKPPLAANSAFTSSSNKCETCTKTVYAMEQIIYDGKHFHKNCLKCTHCNCTLKLKDIASLEGKYYCKPHFKQLFKLKGNYAEGFGKEEHKKQWMQEC